MSLQAFGIMLKPTLAKYLEPLEENGTIAKLQRDVALIAESNAIPELATLVSELQRHNALMERVCNILDAIDRNIDDERLRAATVEPRSDTDATGHDGDIDNGLSELPRPD